MQQKVLLSRPTPAALSALFAAMAVSVLWSLAIQADGNNKLPGEHSVAGILALFGGAGAVLLARSCLLRDQSAGLLRRLNLYLPVFALLLALGWSAVATHDWTAQLFNRQMLLLAAGGTAFFLALAVFYQMFRPVPAISRIGFAFMGIPAFCLAATLFSILSITTGLPMTDTFLARMDTLMGFDWPAFYRWSADQPLFRDYAYLVYHYSFAAIMPVLIAHGLILRDIGRIEQLIAFLMISMLATIAIGALFPSVSGPAYHDIPLALSDRVNAGLDRRYAEFFMAVRGGSKIGLSDIMQGTVTFPSYHALIGAAGILYTMGCRYLRWIVIPPSLAMIAVTPVIGGHFFIDIVGGVLLGLTTYRLVDWMARCDNRVREREPALITT